jgi:hypothetical protein
MPLALPLALGGDLQIEPAAIAIPPRLADAGDKGGREMAGSTPSELVLSASSNPCRSAELVHANRIPNCIHNLGRD